MEEIKTFVGTGDDTPRGEEFVHRNAVTAVLRNPTTDKWLLMRWKKTGWTTFVTGGIEAGQTAQQAAEAELHEETGYKNVQLIKELPSYEAKFYHGGKGENRHASFTCFLFELVDEERDEPDADEVAKHEVIWMSAEEVDVCGLQEGPQWLWNSMKE